jgi:hypothetical protein
MRMTGTKKKNNDFFKWLWKYDPQIFKNPNPNYLLV